ncbi:DegQ family serine endoprotease [Dongia deserti]|uniref:DegQ family serine endoprotease n=1 Tax=Dongia deserti TaxID=2268030 RepID=UPI000E646293|nr:DegQ family serine endoprotease [Dongia deserti]
MRFWIARIGLVIAAFIAAPAMAQDAVPTSTQQINLTFAPVVKMVAPAVVNIYTKKVVRQQALSPFFDDPFFKQFFGDQFNFGRSRERIENALGSGVIVQADGLVVTNNHVIDGADEIRVVLNDGREFEAKLVSQEEQMDLALLRMESKGAKLPTLAFRDSDDLEVGDLVLAIGNPFGVGQTVTSGIVSGLARTRTGINDFGFFIQTDAAINPGNSGGALVTTDGKLVGINTAIFSKTGGSIGIGFAIPSNIVRAVVDAEAQGGKLVRPWLGVTGEALSAEIAESLGFDRPGGVVVKELFPGGPADEAGIKPGDVLLAINGRDVLDPQGMAFRLATLRIGDEATVTVVRKGKPMALAVQLTPAPREPEPDETVLDGDHPLTGARVANLSPALGEELSVNGWRGVVVTGLKRGSFARNLGIRPGDIIARINGVQIQNVKQLRQLVSAEQDKWALTVERDGKVKTVTVR